MGHIACKTPGDEQQVGSRRGKMSHEFLQIKSMSGGVEEACLQSCWAQSPGGRAHPAGARGGRATRRRWRRRQQ